MSDQLGFLVFFSLKKRLAADRHLFFFGIAHLKAFFFQKSPDQRGTFFLFIFHKINPLNQDIRHLRKKIRLALKGLFYFRFFKMVQRLF